jgi:hypothetical protein
VVDIEYINSEVGDTGQQMGDIASVSGSLAENPPDIPQAQ